MVLKRLHVDNFRCLSNFEMLPGQVATLVGPNGGGKSTVFEILRTVQGLLTVGASVEDTFPPSSRTRWDQRLVQRVELDAAGPDGRLFSYAVEIRHDEAGGAPVLLEERLTADGQLLYLLESSQVHLFGDDAAAKPRTTFPFSSTRSFLPLLEPGPDNQLITAFKRWLAGVWLFSLSPQNISPVSQGESDSVLPSGENFVSWYRKLVQETPEVSQQLQVDLQPVIPGLSSIRLRTVGPNAKVLKLECDLSGSTFELSLGELSDGQRALLVLYSILRAIAGHASLLVFDEPDNFVAREEIQPWLSSVRESVASSNRGTLLVISHHPEVIDYLAPDQAFYLWRCEDGPTRIRELEIDLEKGLSASEWLKLGLADAE